VRFQSEDAHLLTLRSANGIRNFPPPLRVLSLDRTTLYVFVTSNTKTEM
jgi:hypothetical protein